MSNVISLESIWSGPEQDLWHTLRDASERGAPYFVDSSDVVSMLASAGAQGWLLELLEQVEVYEAAERRQVAA